MVSRLPTTDRVVALTLDACGGRTGSGYDAELIETLRRERVPATLFVNARWIEANPRKFRRLAADPLFEIANHGTEHRPLSVTGRSVYGIAGTGSVAQVVDEVAVNQRLITRLTGAVPAFFRSGTAYYDDVAVRVVNDLGLQVVNFDVLGDAGATYSAAQVADGDAEQQAGLDHPRAHEPAGQRNSGGNRRRAAETEPAWLPVRALVGISALSGHPDV